MHNCVDRALARTIGIGANVCLVGVVVGMRSVVNVRRFLRRTVFFGVVALIVAALFSTTAGAEATAVPTLTVTPAVVPNGGMVTLAGTATCSSVVIDAHPGALGVRSIRRINARVSNGVFSVRVHLPLFTPDPSRPGLYDDEGFIASCVGSVAGSPTTELRVTGIELPRTGSDTRPLAAVGVTGILVGLTALALARDRTLRARELLHSSRP